MKKLLVTIDFSPAAQNALSYAVDMAMAIGADLHLLHVAEVYMAFSDVALPVNPEEFVLKAKQEFVKISEALQLKTQGRIQVQTEVRVGPFLPALKNVCQEVSPYAVVMGSQGKTAAEHILFGAHANLAVQHLDWPVITVPPLAIFNGIKKIALAVDLLVALDPAPLEEIKTMVKDFNAELHIINIGKKEVFEAEIIFNSRIMGEITKELDPEFHFIAGTHIDEAIINFANQFHVDLLIVLPTHRNLLAGLMHKSHSRQLVLHSFAPVMAIH